MDQLTGFLQSRFVWPVVLALISAVVGTIIGMMFQRWKDRMTVVRWSVTKQRIAFAANHESLGNIGVTFNGAAVDNLFLCWIGLENASASRDLSNLPVEFLVQNETWLVGQGQSDWTGFIPWSTHWTQVKNAYDSATPEQQTLMKWERDFLFKRREFTIPVLNRGDKITFSFVAIPWGTFEPQIVVSSPQAGVLLRHQPTSKMVFGVPERNALIAGLCAVILATVGLTYLFSGNGVVNAVLLSLGLCSTLVGAGLIRLFKAGTGWMK